jgi:hypothetical protein
MSAYKRLYKSDIASIPYVANKIWDISVCDLESYGIRVFNGVKTSSLFDSINDIKTNNEYDRLVYESINHLYYQYYSGSYINTASLLQSNYYETGSSFRPSGSYYDYTPVGYMVKEFPTGSNATIKVLSISKDVYGQSVKKQSFNISSSYINLQDDGKGNVYDSATNPDTFVGNIFYEHGLVIVTNSDYQSIFPIPPFAKDDYAAFSVTQSIKTIYPLANDNGKGWTILTSSLELSGSDISYFTNNNNGTVRLTATEPGTYVTHYKFKTASTASQCLLSSNYAKITAYIYRPICDFLVYVSPAATATPTPIPTSTPTATSIPSTATPTPTPTSPGDPTFTPTPTPTNTPTPTPTATGDPTHTPTNTPTSTPTPTPTPLPVVGEIYIYAENNGEELLLVTAYISSGSAHSDIPVNGGVRQFENPSCVTPTGSTQYFNPGGSNQLVIPSGSSSGTFIQQNTGYGFSGSVAKLVYLEVDGYEMTASPQYVTIGSVRYIITGYNICGQL